MKRGHYCISLPPGRTPDAADRKWCERSARGRCRRRDLELRDGAAHRRARQGAERNPWLVFVREYMRTQGVTDWSEAFRRAKPLYDAKRAEEAPQPTGPMTMAADPITRASTSCGRAAARAAKEEDGTVVSMGALVRGRKGRKGRNAGAGAGAAARRRGERYARRELAEYERLGRLGIVPAVAWTDPAAACVVVKPAVVRTLADVAREQHGRLTPAQKKRLLAICRDPQLSLRPEHARFAGQVFVECADGVLYLIHPMPKRTQPTARRHNAEVVAAVDALLHPSSAVGPLARGALPPITAQGS